MDNWILICAAFSGVPIAICLVLLRKSEKVANLFHTLGKTEHIIIADLVIGGILLIISAALAIFEFETAAFGFLIAAALIMSMMQGIAFSGINDK